MSNISFEHVTIVESFDPLVDLSNYPFICVPVYFYNGWVSSPQMYLRKALADKLLKIQQSELAVKNLKWVIYDGWRSRETQAKIYEYYWQKFSFERPYLSLKDLSALVGTYVAIPDKLNRIPPHSTGGAVDLGLWDCEKAALLPMGAKFDEFVPEVANDFFEAFPDNHHIKNNRRFLKNVLSQLDVTSDADEYFHKDYGSQKWAAQAQMPFAHYGEIVEVCEYEGSVISEYAVNLSLNFLKQRAEQLSENLNLFHPAPSAPTVLKDPDLLVRHLVEKELLGTA